MALTPEDLLLIRAHVAVHEAGHAVAALEQGMPVARVVMGSDGGERTMAYTNFGEHAASDLMVKDPEAMAPVLLAGTSAERYFFDGAHITEGYALDVETVQAHTGWTPDLEVAMAWLQPWVDRARAIVRERREAIETLAATLMTSPGLEREAIVTLVERSETDPLRLAGHLTPAWRLHHDPEGGTEGERTGNKRR